MQDLDFCHSVVETFALLECYTAFVGDFFTNCDVMNVRLCIFE